MDKLNLLPCPFCGAQAKIHTESLDERYAYANVVKVQCAACGVAVSATGDTSKAGYADNSTTDLRAIAAWNRRAAPSSSADELPPLPESKFCAWLHHGKVVNAFSHGVGDRASWDRDGYWSRKGYDRAPLYTAEQVQEAISADRRARQGEPVGEVIEGYMGSSRAARLYRGHVFKTGEKLYRAAIQAAAPAEAPQTPVAWALVSPKGGIKKLAITRASVESRMARWLEEWPGNTPRIRPLVYGDVGAPAEDAQTEQPSSFVQHLQQSAKLVESWPEWKRGLWAEDAREQQPDDSDNLSVMLWLLRRLPRPYGNPPFVAQAINRLAKRTGTDVADSFAERNESCRATGTDRAQAGE